MTLPERLTHQAEWDAYWQGVRLPSVIVTGQSRVDDAILSFLRGAIPRAGARVLEIGGAPGQYLAALTETHEVDAHVLDYSEVGCLQTQKNFELLGRKVTVHRQDLFGDLDLGLFDLVFSLGFIEHFGDLDDVVARHARLVRPGGTLVIGCPNFRGLNGLFLSRLAPALMRQHNLETMDLARWDGFEARLGLQRVFRAYVGGLEPRIFVRSEREDVGGRLLLLGAKVTARLARARALRELDHPWLSQYMLGVYRRP